MSITNQEKTQQLGEPHGTALGKLKKNLLYRMAGQLGLLTCYRCSQPIESVEEFSLEHREAWFHSEDPKGKFFDLDNIAFSHHECNCKHKRCKLRVSNRWGYKGIKHCPGYKTNPFEASISGPGKRNISLGRFATPEEAARAYDKAACEQWGDKAVTNESLGLFGNKES